MYDVQFYETESGSCPVESFIVGLVPKERAKVVRTIELLQEYGPDLREPYSKPLCEGIFELRVSLAGENIRILYFFCSGHIIILTNGFRKKTKKTPASEIERAIRYRKDYLRRRENNE